MVKQEPETYSWTDFVGDGRTDWTGVRNYQARNNLREMKTGDRVLFYHSGKEKAVVGLAEGEAAVEHDIAVGVERVWVDHDDGVVVGGVGLVAEGDRLIVPMDGELVGDPFEDCVGGWIAKEHEVALCDVGVGDLCVGLHRRFAAEDLAPFGDGVGGFGFAPFADVFVQRRAGGRDDDEGIEKGVVDRPL